MAERTVLVVDDELVVRDALRRVLEPGGYRVLDAPGGEEGLALLRRSPVQLVISDQAMPGMSGVDFLKLVRVRHPHIIRIMLTADPDPETVVRSINESEVYRFIRKPWSNFDLKTILHFAFEVIRLQEENRQLIELGRKQRNVRKKMQPTSDPADLEAELLLLAQAETELLEKG